MNMSGRNTSGAGTGRENSDHPDNDTLGSILRKYKALVFPPDQRPDVDESTIERLMEVTKPSRPASFTMKPKLLRFPGLSWLAAAACLMLVFGAAILYGPWQGTPDLVILNSLSTESGRFAMRGGQTNLIAPPRILDTLKNAAARQLGEQRVAIRDEGQSDSTPIAPNAYPGQMLRNVTQRYAIVVTEVEDVSIGHYVLSLFDTRERKCVTISTLSMDATAAEIDDGVGRLLKSVR